MRDWQLTQADPLALRLAADARLGPTDYADDHIWELSLAEGEPPALALRTTYGLRAREMRLFPSFGEGERTVTDPAEFAAPPRVRAFFVNYLRVTCEPLAGLPVTAEYWCPDSHSVAGQWTLVNRGAEPRTIRLALTAVLKPIENPRVLAPARLEEFSALEGRSGNLDIVVALEGPCEVESAPQPRLVRTVELAPGAEVTLRWAEVALPTPARSPSASAGEGGARTTRARRGAAAGGPGPPLLPGHSAALQALFAREWEGEFARIELLNAGLVDIETGDRDWDAAFAFAQATALRSYVGPTAHLPHPSFIFTRIPDRGYSRKGDGSDHMWQWDGQVATEAYVNLPQIVSAAPELAKGVLRNWLGVQEESGFIDWKPGLGGQRNKALSFPLLAALAWKIYEHTEDKAFLAEVYPGLRRFLEVWFTRKHDRDEDGLPEWTHTIQSAFDDCPSFVRWRTWAQGADITLAEAPDLGAYLYRECRSLSRMAALLNLPEDDGLTRRAAVIKKAVEAMWRDDTASFHYVDRDSHEVTSGDVLLTGRGDVTLEMPRRFAPSARIMVKALGPRDARPNMEVVLSGRGRRGRHRVETLRRSHVQWYFGMGTAVSEKLYAELDRVEVRGLTDEYEVTVSVVDYARQDQTLLLPLWAGLPDAPRADALVRKTLLDANRYWRPYGIPNCSALDPAYRADNRDGSGGVWLMWNTMLGEGLVDYGYRAEAVQLITRLMTAMLFTLKGEKAFREAYNPDQLEGLGDRDYLWGVAPVHLFLYTLGVRIVNPKKVWLADPNPFPWPVTVRYKGVTVTKTSESARVEFPSGKQVSVTDMRPQFVEDS